MSDFTDEPTQPDARPLPPIDSEEWHELMTEHSTSSHRLKPLEQREMEIELHLNDLEESPLRGHSAPSWHRNIINQRAVEACRKIAELEWGCTSSASLAITWAKEVLELAPGETE